MKEYIVAFVIGIAFFFIGFGLGYNEKLVEITSWSSKTNYNLTTENKQLKEKITILEKEIQSIQKWGIDNSLKAATWNSAFENLYQACDKKGQIKYHFIPGAIFRQSELLDNIYTLTEIMRKEKKPLIKKWGDKIGPDGRVFCE